MEKVNRTRVFVKKNVSRECKCTLFVLPGTIAVAFMTEILCMLIMLEALS